MNTESFKESALKEGYEVGEPSELKAGREVPEHTHPFDAKLMVLEGEITIGIDGVKTTYTPSDIFAVSSETAHTESVGPNGVKLLVGRR